VPRVFEKAGDVTPAPKITEQVLGIIIGVEVPLFPLAVLMAEVAHRGAILTYAHWAVNQAKSNWTGARKWGHFYFSSLFPPKRNRNVPISCGI
jgi:hypothetical protein